MSYIADPRAEELQLLRQISRQPCVASHSATVEIAQRLEGKHEAFILADYHARLWVEISSKGRRTLGIKPNGQT